MSDMGEDGAGAGRGTWIERGGRQVMGWLGEKGLMALLAMLTLDLFLLPVIGPGVGQVTLDIVFLAMLLTGVWALSQSRFTRIVAAVFALEALVFRYLERWDATPITLIGANTASMVALGAFTVLVLLRTLSPGPITSFRIQGAVAAYLLIGVTFGQAFELLEYASPGSFDFALETAPHQISYGLNYFSIITLTTVGYGDITPVSAEARSLAAFEGFIGQIYPAILLGWMVSSLKTRPAD